MGSGILKRYWTFSARTFGLLSVAAGLIFCASIDFEYSDYASSFFAPEVAKKGEASPFFRSFQTFYGDAGIFDNNDFGNVNITEWKTFFDNKVSPADLDALLYADNRDITYIDTLIFFAKNPTYPISDHWRRNTINIVSAMPKRLEFLYYLGFAKRCEPYVTKPDDAQWYQMPGVLGKQDQAERDKIIANGPKLISSLHIPFVKQRAHFQMVRLLFMVNNEACTKYMEDNRREIDSAGTTVIKCRTWSYAATALYRQKEYAKANYMFSIIFDQMPTMQKTAMYYFHPMEEKDWGQCLAMARSPHERSVMWAMTGIQGSDEIRAMKEIYKIEPSSDMLDLLLVRLVNISEESYLTGAYKFQTNIWSDDGGGKASTIVQAADNLRSMMDDMRLHNRPLWYLSEGYLCQMQHKYTGANIYYDKACAMAPADTLLAQQAHVLKIVANAELTTVLDLRKENEVLADLVWLQQKHHPSLRTSAAYAALRSIISGLYAKQNNPVMAQLSAGFRPDFYFRDSNVYKMITFINKPDKTPLEDFFVLMYERHTDDMYYFLGLREIYRGHLASARQKWPTLTPTIDVPTMGFLSADPFLIHKIDCHDCDHAAGQKTKYTRAGFLDKMTDLEKQATSGKKDAAAAYFQMANGFYNITYFGNNRMFYENNISGTVGYYDNYQFDPTGKDSTKFAPDVFDCRLALSYYLKARDASSDIEFKAKCTYMAAKCEHNMSNQVFIKYENGKFGFNENADFGKYFKELRENYARTAYEKEVVQECSYFKAYLNISR